jgi:ferredoxin-NADP reductase
VHESGKIEVLIARNRETMSTATLMAAGFDPFLDRVGQALHENGIDPKRLISETFGPMP